MKKFVLLASLMALAALALAASPAAAQPVTEINGFRFIPGDCGNREGTDLTQEEAEELLEEEGLDPEDLPDAGNVCLLDDGDDGNGNGNGDGDDNGDNGDDNNNEGIIDRDRVLLRDVGNFEFAPSFEASQETEVECDTGEVSQSTNVTGGGDNSITTVGLQPIANTGCAQNATGILAADPIFAAQGGDLAFNFDDTNVVIRDDDCDGEDNDGDGNRDEDGDCDGDDNGNHNDDDNGDDNGDNVVDITDRDVFRFGGDQLNIHGGGGGEFDVNTDSTIDISPSLDVDGGGTINQTAIAVSVDDDHHKWWDHHKGWA